MGIWKLCKLKEIAEITMGQSPKSEYYNFIGEGTPFLQGNRTFGRKYPTFDTYTTNVTKMATKGSVIMSVRAPVGDINITPVDMCLGRGVCGIRMKNDNQTFLYYLIKSNVGHIINKENGTVFGSINKKDIDELDVYIPELNEEQQTLGNTMACIDEKIELNSMINDNLAA